MTRPGRDRAQPEHRLQVDRPAAGTCRSARTRWRRWPRWPRRTCGGRTRPAAAVARSRLRRCHTHESDQQHDADGDDFRDADRAPIALPQLYCWPFCTPNTIASRPSTGQDGADQVELVAVALLVAGQTGSPATKPTTPIGTLTMKIHCQPKLSTSTPPSSGPAMVATPATAPHMPIGAPRLAGGNIAVMNAIVCGAIAAAPSPCTARAAISISGRCRTTRTTATRAVNTARPLEEHRLAADPVTQACRPAAVAPRR